MYLRAHDRYRQLDNLTAVQGRSPAELTLLVFDRLIQRLQAMERAIDQERWADMRQESQRAVELVTDGLISALDPARGEAVADNLGRLYDYAVRRLLQATLRKDAAIVREVAGLMGELRTGWAAITPQARETPALERGLADGLQTLAATASRVTSAPV
jgi:flagellar protein FliS